MLTLARMLVAVAIAAALAAAAPGGDTRADLDALAQRIERLKARRLAGEDVGDELERLLVRAREIAARLEREATPPPRPPPGVAPDELHERADALRDEADRAAATAARLDRQIEDAMRAARLEAGLANLLSESELFGDAGMTRVGARASSSGATSGTSAPPPGGVAVPGGSGATSDSSGGTTGSTSRAATLAPSGAGGRGDPLPGDPAARLRALRAARAEAAARAAALRAQAAALDAEAHALESRER